MEPIYYFISILLSATITYISAPFIRKIGLAKQITCLVNTRSSHAGTVTPLGGVAIFLGLTLSLICLAPSDGLQSLFYLLGSMIIIFFTGLTDDLVSLRPKYKVFGQVAASAILIIFSRVELIGLHGLLGINLLPPSVSIMFTIFIFVLFINAFNLIDGIDGLASTQAILCSLWYGIIFYNTSNKPMLLLSCAIFGSLLSFLIFNFSKKRKMFMGDTGSMLIGLLLIYQGVSISNLGYFNHNLLDSNNSLIFACAPLLLPLIDTSRVFAIRLYRGNSPFSPDRNHIHHLFSLLGIAHWKISGILGLVTIYAIAFAMLSRSFSVTESFVLILCSTICLLISVVLLAKIKIQGVKKKNIEREPSSYY